MQLQGKRVVLTGAGGGIGRAMLAALKEAGAYVIACDRAQSGLSAEGAVFDERVEFDITDVAETEAAAARIGAQPVDVLISNAGGTRVDLMELTDTAAILSDLQLNFTGAAVFSRALLPSMRHRPDGAAAVFVASVNGLSHFGSPAYSAAKAGLIAWAKALATEEGKNGLRANVVAPGSVHTPAWDDRPASPIFSTRSWRSIPWGGWSIRKRSPMRHCFWPRPPPVGSPAPFCPWMLG